LVDILFIIHSSAKGRFAFVNFTCEQSVQNALLSSPQWKLNDASLIVMRQKKKQKRDRSKREMNVATDNLLRSRGFGSVNMPTAAVASSNPASSKSVCACSLQTPISRTENCSHSISSTFSCSKDVMSVRDKSSFVDETGSQEARINTASSDVPIDAALTVTGQPPLMTNNLDDSKDGETGKATRFASGKNAVKEFHFSSAHQTVTSFAHALIKSLTLLPFPLRWKVALDTHKEDVEGENFFSLPELNVGFEVFSLVRLIPVQIDLLVCEVARDEHLCAAGDPITADGVGKTSYPLGVDTLLSDGKLKFPKADVAQTPSVRSGAKLIMKLDFVRSLFG
jgi:hypothetical protein